MFRKIRPIQIQINSAHRNILYVNYDNLHRLLLSTNIMFLKLNMLIFKYFMSKFIQSCVHGKNYTTFQEHFELYLPSHTNNTRNLKLNYPCLKLEVEKKHLPVYNFIKLYNELSSNLLKPQTSYKLKKNFRHYRLQKYHT